MVDFPKRELKLISVSDIIETEEHCHDHALNLAESIRNSGLWMVPITIDSATLAVMDGHHRLNEAKFIGLARVPCLLMSYETGGVSVNSWRDDITCSVESIRSMIKRSRKYPMKTTRHIFNPSIKEIKIPLGLLY